MPSQKRPNWVNKRQPVGFFGGGREQQFASWNNEFGDGKWRVSWVLADGTALNFDQMFQLYVEGYAEYFRKHPEEAVEITQNYSYAYDKTPISADSAFDPHALLNKPDLPNQFHHVALNLALTENLGLKFQGDVPLQVRDGKPDQPVESWPKGWKWGPGHIPFHDPSLIPKVELQGWWDQGSIEDLYQKAKTLQVNQGE